MKKRKCLVCENKTKERFCSECRNVLEQMIDKAIAELPSNATWEEECSICMGAELALILNPDIRENYNGI